MEQPSQPEQANTSPLLTAIDCDAVENLTIIRSELSYMACNFTHVM